MTDRPAPPAAFDPAAATTPFPGDPRPLTPPEPAPTGDAPPMPLTLAPPTHGRPATDHPTATPAPDRGRAWLARLAAGPALPAVAPAPVPAGPRTPAEHDALARALGCPDLFVLDAADRPARERLLADLARLAGLNGRVLVLSPDPASADRIAELAAAGGAAVVRALADDENPLRPSPAVTRLTSHSAGHGKVEQLRREAVAAVAAATRQVQRFDAAARAAAALADIADEQARAKAELAELEARRAAVEAEVRSEVEARLKAEHEAATARLTADRAAAEAALAEKEAALAEARRHLAEVAAEAGKKPGFLARLLGKAKPHEDPAELERRIHDLVREAADATELAAKRKAEFEAAAERLAAERDRRVADEVGPRLAELDIRLSGLRPKLDGLASEFNERFGLVVATGFDVTEGNAASARQAAAKAGAARADAERQLTEARQKLDELNRSAPELARRFLAETRVVVGTPGSLDVDPVFAGAAFDLLALDRAEELTEPDFARLSGLAGRWVLAGDASWPDDHRPHANGSGRHHRRGPTFTARLARHLDREPWAVEGDRLVLRLAHPTADERRAMIREPLADSPHVEIRVAPAADGGAVLAEVAFPAATPLAEAKAFLFAQLDEVVLLRPCGECRWHHADDAITACWPAADTATGECAWVDLAPGVREKLVGHGSAAFTAAVAFDPARGWDAGKAADWLAARLPAAGRLAVLPRGPAAPAHAPRPAAVG